MTTDHEQEETVEIPDEHRQHVARYIGVERAREISDFNTVEGSIESLKREVRFGVDMFDEIVGMSYVMGLIHGMACKCVHLYGLKRGVAAFNNVVRRPIEEILGGMTGSVSVSASFIEDAIDKDELGDEADGMSEEIAAYFAQRVIARDELDNPSPEDEV